MRDAAGSRSFSVWVDLFRWMAAASVLITHAGLRMLVPVTEMPAFSAPHAAYAFVAGFDHQAVMVFFVLSGLLVGGSVVREIETTGRVDVGAYAGRRMVRLCIVLWPAFGLATACTTAAIALGAVDRGILPPDVLAALSPSVLLCNAAFLQTAACVQYADNGALWSLFNEFWYYVLFPPIALALLSRIPTGRRVAMAGLAFAMLAGLTSVQFTGSPMGPYMLVWMVGVAAAALPRAIIVRGSVAAMLFVAASLAVRLGLRRAFAGQHPLVSAEIDLLLALLFGNLLLTLRYCADLRPPPAARLHTALAGFSFSLYCTHIPVLVLYITILASITGYGWQMTSIGGRPWLAVLGGLGICTCIGWAFARATEAHTGIVRAWLANTWPVQRIAVRAAR